MEEYCCYWCLKTIALVCGCWIILTADSLVAGLCEGGNDPSRSRNLGYFWNRWATLSFYQ